MGPGDEEELEDGDDKGVGGEDDDDTVYDDDELIGEDPNPEGDIVAGAS